MSTGLRIGSPKTRCGLRRGGSLAARYAVLYDGIAGDVAAYVLLNNAGPTPADLTATAGNKLEVYGDPIFSVV